MLTLLLITAVILIVAILIIIDKIRFKKNRRYYYETRDYGIFGYILLAMISVFVFILIIARLYCYLDINDSKKDYYNIMRDKISITNIEDKNKYEQFACMINDRIDVYNSKIDELKRHNASPWWNIYVPNDVEYLMHIDEIE